MRSVWIPDFIIYNHVDLFEEHIRHEESRIFLYGDGGGVYWTRPAVVNVLGDFDARHFPFDTQTLELETGSWSYSGFLQNLSVMAYTRESVEGRTQRVTNGELDM